MLPDAPEKAPAPAPPLPRRSPSWDSGASVPSARNAVPQTFPLRAPSQSGVYFTATSSGRPSLIPPARAAPVPSLHCHHPVLVPFSPSVCPCQEYGHLSPFVTCAQSPCRPPWPAGLRVSTSVRLGFQMCEMPIRVRPAGLLRVGPARCPVTGGVPDVPLCATHPPGQGGGPLVVTLCLQRLVC